MDRISGILDNVAARLGLRRRLAESALMEFWSVTIGQPWAGRSRPLCIDKEGQLVVAVSDSSTAQELTFMKAEVLAKLQEAAKALGVRLTGIRFDLKRFYDKC